MENKNRLIEEMAHELRGCNSKDKCGSCNCIYNYCDEYYDAEIAITEGYRKLSKDSIVLTKAEKEKLLHEMYEQGRFDAIADLDKEDKVVLSIEELNEMLELRTQVTTERLLDILWNSRDIKREIQALAKQFGVNIKE